MNVQPRRSKIYRMEWTVVNKTSAPRHPGAPAGTGERPVVARRGALLADSPRRRRGPGEVALDEIGPPTRLDVGPGCRPAVGGTWRPGCRRADQSLDRAARDLTCPPGEREGLSVDRREETVVF